MIAPHQKRQLEAIGGDDGLSAGLRAVVTAGLLALQGDAALLAPVDQLHALVDKLAAVTGRRTPAGAWWAPTPDALPDPRTLDPAGSVIATPGAVLLCGTTGTLVVDLDEGKLTANNGQHEISAPIDLSDLVHPAALLPASLAGLAVAGPGRRELGLGLAIERCADDSVRISMQGVGAHGSINAAQIFAAELLALLARASRASAAARMQLEQSLQEVA
jgi:hypothetical protein